MIFISILTLRSQPCVSNCSLYAISSVTPAFLFNAGGNAGSNELFLSDDQVSGSVPLGFSFSFMCATYTNCYVSSNGFLSFNPSVGNGCCAGQTCPTVNGNPNNYVAWAWCDLYPPGNGFIKYQTLGTAPNRIFVLTYSVIPFVVRIVHHIQLVKFNYMKHQIELKYIMALLEAAEQKPRAL